MEKISNKDSFNNLKKLVDLSLSFGVVKTIEDTKVIYDSLVNLAKLIEEVEKAPNEPKVIEEKK